MHQAVPDEALAALPVHTHHSPKKSSPAAASGGAPAGHGALSFLQLNKGTRRPKLLVPLHQGADLEPLPLRLQPCSLQQIITATPESHRAWGAGDSEEPLCSVCLETFVHGCKVRPSSDLSQGCAAEWLWYRPRHERCFPQPTHTHTHHPSPPQVMRLPCHHEFHEQCFTPWVRLKGFKVVCPVCKKFVF